MAPQLAPAARHTRHTIGQSVLNQHGRRVAWLAVIAGLLSPVTGAGILRALAHKVGTSLPLDVPTIGTFAYFWVLVVYSVLFAALPAALFAGMGASSLLALRTRGLSHPALLSLGAVLGLWPFRRSLRRRAATKPVCRGRCAQRRRVGIARRLRRPESSPPRRRALTPRPRTP